MAQMNLAAYMKGYDYHLFPTCIYKYVCFVFLDKNKSIIQTFVFCSLQIYQSIIHKTECRSRLTRKTLELKHGEL